MEQAKKCTKCGLLKSVNEFHKEARAKDGLRTQCRECLNNYDRQHYAKSKHRRFNRYISMAKNKWGISSTQYKSMLKEQNGKCAICNGTSNGRRLAVDHCHKTGEIRGLLCGKCNIGIGQFNDNTELLQKAISYIKSPITLPETEK